MGDGDLVEFELSVLVVKRDKRLVFDDLLKQDAPNVTVRQYYKLLA